MAALTEDRIDFALEEEAFPTETIDRPAIDGVAQQVEALLFGTHHPLTLRQLGDLMRIPDRRLIEEAIDLLNGEYIATGRTFRAEHVAGGYQLLTRPQWGELLQRLHGDEAEAKLTNAAQETLAIVAYKQPTLRTDVEAIRGVGCGEALRGLMQKRLVKIAGRSELPGRPILYGTTKRFLEVFGLNSLKDLPKPE